MGFAKATIREHVWLLKQSGRLSPPGARRTQYTSPRVKDLRSHSSDTVLAKPATRVLDYNHWDGGRFAANKTAVVLESIPTEPENRAL